MERRAHCCGCHAGLATMLSGATLPADKAVAGLNRGQRQCLSVRDLPILQHSLAFSELPQTLVCALKPQLAESL